MLIAFIAILLLINAISIFSFSLNMNAVNRIIAFTPKQIFEVAIPTYIEEEKEPYFDKTILLNGLTHYYDLNLKNKVMNYSMRLSYYNPEDRSYCLDEYCRGVEVDIDIKLNSIYSFNRNIYYEIRRNN